MPAPDPRQEEVLEWMAETQGGYRAAARKFKIPIGTIKSWVHRARAVAKAEADAAREKARAKKGKGKGPKASSARKPARARTSAVSPKVDDRDAQQTSRPDAVSGSKIPTPAVLAQVPHQDANAVVQQLRPGGWVCGVTKGQFSMLDLVVALVQHTGQKDVELICATWTIGVRDAVHLRDMLKTGELASFLLITDKSFPFRAPSDARRLTQLFGREAILCTSTHAKFALIRAGGWHIVARASMNMNRNPRFEQFDVTDSATLYGFFSHFVEDLRSNHSPGWAQSTVEVEEGFELVMSGAPGMAAAKKDDGDMPIGDIAGLDLVAFLERKLGELELDIRAVRADNSRSLLSKLHNEQRTTRKELEQARESLGKVRALKRTAEALALGLRETEALRERLLRHHANRMSGEPKVKTL